MVFLAEVPQAAVRRAGQDVGISRTWLHSPTGMGNSCRCQVALSSPTPSFLLFSFFLQALTISFPIFSPFSSYYFSFFFSPPLLAQHFLLCVIPAPGAGTDGGAQPLQHG